MSSKMNSPGLLEKFVYLRKNSELLNSDASSLELRLELDDISWIYLKDLITIGIADEYLHDVSLGKSLSVSEIDGNHKRRRIVYTLYIQSLKKEGHHYYSFARDFIKYNQTKEPKSYYINELDFLSTNPDIPSIIKQYRCVLIFIELLKTVSDYHDKSTGANDKLVILYNQKVELLIKYRTEDIEELQNLSLVNKLFETIVDNKYHQHKIDILKKIITDYHNRNNTNVFIQILEDFEEFYNNFKRSFEFFLSEFTLEQFLETFETKKIEYIAKIDSIVSDIQNKVVAIPIAFILATAQLDYAQAFTSKNIAILIGIFFFTLLLQFLINGQISSLDDIKDDFQSHSDKYKEKFSLSSEFIEDKFNSLNKKYSSHRKLLIKISIAVWVLSLILLLVVISTHTNWW